MISGILLIDKPEGVTSFEVVRRARQALGIRKIGHLGTLDPMATGLLPLCLLEATKLVPYLMPESKVYRAPVRLGMTTDTQDATGTVVATSEARPAPAQIYQAAAAFVGEVTQVPPMYSALHCQGERAYRLARRGEAVDLPARTVTVYELTVDEVALPEFTMTVTVLPGHLCPHPGPGFGRRPGMRGASVGSPPPGGGSVAGGRGPNPGGPG